MKKPHQNATKSNTGRLTWALAEQLWPRTKSNMDKVVPPKKAVKK